ncbi:MAG: sulfite exporter TauE/SafE family protein, partial [Rhodothermia bacterium]
MEVVTILVGLLIGTLVGISGIGGAVMLLPLLIIVLKVPPLIAVGSDAVFAALTKIGAGAVHFRQKTVDLSIVLYLAIGSIPGALVGFRGLAAITAASGDAIDGVLRMLIGVLLIVITVFLLAQIRMLRSRKTEIFSNEDDEPVKKIQTIVIGLVGGLLVGLTS